MKSKAALTWMVVVACVASSAGGCDAPPETPNTIDVVNWWTEDGERDAMRALELMFESRFPKQDVKNIDIGPATKARETIRNLVVGGFPPETFQANGGWDLLAWVAYNNRNDDDSKLEPLDPGDWAAAIPPPVLDTVRLNGSLYAVPLNIHRLNMLFFNRAVFVEHGLEPPEWNDDAPSTLGDLFALCDKLRAAGVARPIALAMGDREWWPLALYLFENILVARAGGEGYLKFFSGDPDLDIPNWPPLQLALADLSRLLAYDPQAGSRTWVDAVEEMSKGDAAMTIMGDWAKGYIDRRGEPVDYGAIPTPGTEGTFVFTTDTFGLPRGADNPEGARKLLELFGSQEAQDKFNQIKGSIPARAGGAVLEFTGFSRQNISSFVDIATSGEYRKLVPATSILAPPDYMASIYELLGDYAGVNRADRAGNVSVVLYGLRNQSDVLENSQRIWRYGNN